MNFANNRIIYILLLAGLFLSPIASLGDSFITLSIKPWVNVEDFVISQAEIYQPVLESFQEKQVEIAAPRQTVRMIS